MKLAAPLVCLAGLALSGCSTLPTAGPSARQVVDQAVVEGRQRYDVVDVNAHVVSTLLAQPKASFRTMFGKYGKPPEPKIGIGDTVSVSIWEASAGGLFGGTTAPATGTENIVSGSHSVTIPAQIVTRDGAISVPYAGRVPVAGKSTLAVQREIEARLAGKAIEPQAIVSLTHTVTDTATVEGEVVNGARVPLSVGGDRLLDLIAAAGGAKSPVYATFVRLSRDGVTVTIPMTRLIADPRENIYGWPGDVLTLVQIPQTFSVFGATGANTQLPFNAERMTLADAMARAGGLQDQRADPAGVFLFRYEPPAVVGALGTGNLASGPDRSSPVVYRLDFRDADSYFLAKQFPLEDKDIIYVSNALLSDVQKFFTLLNTVTGPVISGFVVNRAVNQ